ncbi:MAG: hypothetical protein Q9201_001170 [Fulgogasparrea decipioides]
MGAFLSCLPALIKHKQGCEWPTKRSLMDGGAGDEVYKAQVGVAVTMIVLATVALAIFLRHYARKRKAKKAVTVAAAGGDGTAEQGGLAAAVQREDVEREQMAKERVEVLRKGLSSG